MKYTEEEIREAAKFTPIGEGLIDLLIKALNEIKEEKNPLS